jgi:ankyrin repeat protein
MTYNKKQMQPLIEKFQINPETNKLFINIIEMFDNQPNYQIWAVKGVFSKTFEYETLAKIHDWAVTNQNMIKLLEKKNIVSYSTKTLITQLIREMNALDKVAIIKDIISHFNTDQRRMLTASILPRELNGIEAAHDAKVKEWGDIFAKFNRLPSSRKNNFYTKASGIRDIDELQKLIKESLEATYTWNKEDLLAFVENNTRGCEIVFNQGPYVIIRIPNFETSKKLCGGGRTQWCITMESHHWNDYVGRYASDSHDANRSQYFLFDFNRRETDPFAHVGFTIQKGSGIVEAQSCDNKPMLNEKLDNGVEKMNVHDVLAKVGAKMGTFIHLPKDSEFKWNTESMLKFIKDNPGLYAVALEKDNRYIINILAREGLTKIISHSLINGRNIPVDQSNKVYVLLDMNLPVNDDKALLVMRYQKDQYGDVSLRNIFDLFNADITTSKYLNEIGISPNDFLNREAIDPSILLHKLIDENDELGAIALIEKEKDNINVSYEFNMRVPIFSVLNNKMFKLFGHMVAHPTFNAKIEDGFGESLLESLLYMYGADEVSSSQEEEKDLETMIKAVLDNENFDLNTKDLNGDTSLTIACEYPKMNWVAKALVAKQSVDVNLPNDFGFSPLAIAITHGNMDVVESLCKRPDLKVTEEDKSVAKSHNINLKDYLKPDNSVFTTTEANSMADLLSELESAATVMA